MRKSGVHRRVERQGLHGHEHIAKQRRLALILVVTAFVRVTGWTSLMVLYAVGVPFTSHLFESVAFVAMISLYANAATDFGQGCASLAQLTAADAHHDAEVARREVQVDTTVLEQDIVQLAELQPGAEAQLLAEQITDRLRHT